ncbi:hypothetical protein BSL78_05462 [Apostichopus japonicus]|uniref:ZU5 domain-containing protein n=1 Tax=Stichopus japonicus TaxID=307972 RepID=A0A2G8LBJ6_STIJA|nr:hypothetical protein BSL78_05462 [Apostichopus japonicus]
MFIAGVCLLVPAGALHTGRIACLWVSTDPAVKGPISNKSLRLTPFVKFGPESLTLHKPVTLIIPHCALTTTNQMGIEVYSGVLQTDKSAKWSLERKHLSCSMNSQHFAVEAQKPCFIGLHVPFIPMSLKHVCVLPILNRVSESGDQLTIHLWFDNDDSLEHKVSSRCFQLKCTGVVAEWIKAVSFEATRLSNRVVRGYDRRAGHRKVGFSSKSNLRFYHLR